MKRIKYIFFIVILASAGMAGLYLTNNEQLLKNQIVPTKERAVNQDSKPSSQKTVEKEKARQDRKARRQKLDTMSPEELKAFLQAEREFRNFKNKQEKNKQNGGAFEAMPPKRDIKKEKADLLARLKAEYAEKSKNMSKEDSAKLLTQLKREFLEKVEALRAEKKRANEERKIKKAP